jgi:hypothetical protein
MYSAPFYCHCRQSYGIWHVTVWRELLRLWEMKLNRYEKLSLPDPNTKHSYWYTIVIFKVSEPNKPSCETTGINNVTLIMEVCVFVWVENNILTGFLVTSWVLVSIIQQDRFQTTKANVNSSNTRHQMHYACTGACSFYCITNTSFRISNMDLHIV